MKRLAGRRTLRGSAAWRATLPLFSFVAFVSCGGGGDGPAPPSVPVPPAPPAPEPPPPMIGTPCPGVVVRGAPPVRETSVTSAELIIEWDAASGGGSFDWSGPYYDFGPNFDLLVLEVNIADWRVERTATMTRHSIRAQWPPFLEFGLGFRRNTGACELPSLVCSGTGCELEP